MLLDVSKLRHVVYTYSVRTVEQKYVKWKSGEKVAKKNSHNGDESH